MMQSRDFFMSSQAELLECLRGFILQWETSSQGCDVSACSTVSVGMQRLVVGMSSTWSPTLLVTKISTLRAD